MSQILDERTRLAQAYSDLLRPLGYTLVNVDYYNVMYVQTKVSSPPRFALCLPPASCSPRSGLFVRSTFASLATFRPMIWCSSTPHNPVEKPYLGRFSRRRCTLAMLAAGLSHSGRVLLQAAWRAGWFDRPERTKQKVRA